MWTDDRRDRTGLGIKAAERFEWINNNEYATLEIGKFDIFTPVIFLPQYHIIYKIKQI